MQSKLDCPYCDGVAPLREKDDHIFYMDKVHNFILYFYKCESCGSEFTTTESDTKSLSQIPGYPQRKD